MPFRSLVIPSDCAGQIAKELEFIVPNTVQVLWQMDADDSLWATTTSWMLWDLSIPSATWIDCHTNW